MPVLSLSVIRSMLFFSRKNYDMPFFFFPFLNNQGPDPQLASPLWIQAEGSPSALAWSSPHWNNSSYQVSVDEARA